MSTAKHLNNHKTNLLIFTDMQQHKTLIQRTTNRELCQ